MIRQTPEIFLSYSRTDLEVAGKMAAALKAAGHDVWWDQALKAGEVYDRVTEAALRQARLVVVLWSAASVDSDWVRSEATIALQRGALVPVMIEACQRPVMFELRQSADLIGWKGNAKDPRLLAFLDDVKRQLGAGPAAIAPAVVPPSGPSRRQLIGGTAALAAVAGAGVIGWRQLGGKADDGTASVVVLPFANLSGDAAQAYFSDGIAEELRNALAQVSGLKVIGRVSSEKFRDTDDLPAAASKLGVDHVLTGSVRRSPSTIRIAAQLVDGRTGVESWSQSYDQPVGDALAIQSKIANSVVSALSAKLGAAAGTIVVGGTRNPAAQELFLQAEDLGRKSQSKAIMTQQITLLDAAIALDPAYAEAWATKGNVVSFSRSYSTNAAEIAALLATAMAASQRAVALAPGSGLAHMSLAIRYRNRLDMRRAVAEAETALRLAPADGRVVSEIGNFLRNVYPERGLAMTGAALVLDPLNPTYVAAHASALNSTHLYEQGLAEARRAMAMSNKQIGGMPLVIALFRLGRIKEARENLPFVQLDTNRTTLSAAIEARSGNRAASDAALAAGQKIDDGSVWLRTAYVHAQRGETALALDAVEESLRHREPLLFQMAVTPFFDPIRGEPRFKAVQDAVYPPDLFVPPKRGRA